LDKSGHNTEDAEVWLMSQTIKPTNLVWYLEIDSSQPTDCTITYDSIDYKIKIGEDKKINTKPGSCLSLSQGDYWLQVSPDCYGKEFTISCDESFLTTLLYKEKNSSSSTIYVS
jgi:hypothetical protein